MSTESPSGVYTIDVDPSRLQFVEDTVLGVFLPDAALSRIRLEFDNKGGPLGYYTTVSPVTGTAEDMLTLSGALVASDLPHNRFLIGK